MTPAHRARRAPGLSSTLSDHPGPAITAVLVIAGALGAVGVFFAATEGGSAPVAPAAVSAPANRLDSPQARAYFGALFADALIGPRDLSAENALTLGDHVCADLHGGASVFKVSAYLRGVTKLSDMQAARLADAADRNLCRK